MHNLFDETEEILGFWRKKPGFITINDSDSYPLVRACYVLGTAESSPCFIPQMKSVTLRQDLSNMSK